MNKEDFYQYSLLKKEEKRVEAALKELRPKIVEQMGEANADKTTSEFGTFTVKPVSVYKYSKAVDDLLKKVDELKEDEKARGIATSDVRYDLVFTASKK